QIMKREKVDQLYITSSNQKLLGLVQLEQLRTHFQEEEKRLSDIMESNVIQVSPDLSVGEVASLFADKNLTTIPVVANRKIIGLITRSSMIHGIADWELRIGWSPE